MPSGASRKTTGTPPISLPSASTLGTSILITRLIGGVPVVLRDAPLGTYLGWNITAGNSPSPLWFSPSPLVGEGRDGGRSTERPFHANKACTYTGGMLPFAKTKAERLANNDTRLSLEERYGDHAGYVAAVKKAAANAVAQKFLLQKDADALVAAAEGSGVLR